MSTFLRLHRLSTCPLLTPRAQLWQNIAGGENRPGVVLFLLGYVWRSGTQSRSSSGMGCDIVHGWRLCHGAGLKWTTAISIALCSVLGIGSMYTVEASHGQYKPHVPSLCGGEGLSPLFAPLPIIMIMYGLVSCAGSAMSYIKILWYHIMKSWLHIFIWQGRWIRNPFLIIIMKHENISEWQAVQ